MASIPTVEINRDGHRLIINESDYNPDVDTLWSDRPNALQETKEASKEQIDLAPIEARLAELQALAQDGNWRTLKAISEGHGITRPGDGWDAAVLPILVAEYGQAAAEEVFPSPEATP